MARYKIVNHILIISHEETAILIFRVIVMHQSIPAVPIPPPPPPGNRGAFAQVVSPGGWALAYPRATPGHLTHVFSN